MILSPPLPNKTDSTQPSTSPAETPTVQTSIRRKSNHLNQYEHPRTQRARNLQTTSRSCLCAAISPPPPPPLYNFTNNPKSYLPTHQPTKSPDPAHVPALPRRRTLKFLSPRIFPKPAGGLPVGFASWQVPQSLAHGYISGQSPHSGISRRYIYPRPSHLIPVIHLIVFRN